MIAAVLLALLLQSSIPPPSGPVIFCGSQAAPAAVSYQLVFDGGAPEALTMDATKDPACAASDTNSFRLAASKFTVGTHTLLVKATNTFGTTDGDVYNVTVGIAPGKFTITAIRQD